MKKNKQVIEQRTALIELAINNPNKAAAYFEHAAISLKQANNTKQVIDILAKSLFLSERTIEKEFEKTA